MTTKRERVPRALLRDLGGVRRVVTFQLEGLEHAVTYRPIAGLEAGGPLLRVLGDAEADAARQDEAQLAWMEATVEQLDGRPFSRARLPDVPFAVALVRAVAADMAAVGTPMGFYWALGRGRGRRR